MRVRCLPMIAVLILVAGSGCSRRSQLATPAPRAPAVNETHMPAPRGGTESDSGRGQVTAVDLSPIFFGYDSASLTEEGRAILDRLARDLRRETDVALVVEGHCDERGTIEYNLALGERRAQAVRDYLMTSGVAPERIRVISYGKERPFADGHDEVSWAQNRRAHIARR